MGLEKIKTSANVIDTFTQQAEEKPVVVELPIENLIPYRSHPFALYEGERLDDMVESVSENGVLTPIIVQAVEDGKYEILAGHNRWNASRIAGKKTIPAIIKTGLTPEEAYIYVVETNVFQRGFDNLKMSEQAAVIAERTDSFREEKRNAIREEIKSIDDTNRADEAVGEEYGMNSKRIARLVRIHRYLIPELKALLDEDRIPFVGAIDLSFLTKNEQKEVAALSEDYDLSLKKCAALKALSIKGELDDITAVLDDTAVKEQNAPKMKPIKIHKEIFDKFFPKGADRDYVQDVTELALNEYFKNHPIEKDE
ncbi:MAG: ParB/RepB/Spo0J family partition protein [Clostridia bacterium]|nr:ParB/RepB/Spo0J family partition protein [Clostridia bacterium]